MAAPVSFDYTAWVARYPEFAAVDRAVVEGYFAEATLYWRNDGTSPNKTAITQSMFLNMLTAHIAALYSQGQGAASPGQPQDPNSGVGRVSQATVGSVSVTTELNLVPTSSGLQAWLSQTKYGLGFWAATTAYRKVRYFMGGGPSGGPLPWNNGAL